MSWCKGSATERVECSGCQAAPSITTCRHDNGRLRGSPGIHKRVCEPKVATRNTACRLGCWTGGGLMATMLDSLRQLASPEIVSSLARQNDESDHSIASGFSAAIPAI